MAMVKADAYGHGAVETARVMENYGVDAFGVAFIDEAMQLRQGGITSPILIAGHCPIECAPALVDNNITPAIYNFRMAKAMSNAALRKDKTAKVHLKIDTGMGRIGYIYTNNAEQNADTVNAIKDLATLPNIEIEGIFSHLACADEERDTYSETQFDRFMELICKLEAEGLKIPVKHIANSAACMRYQHMNLDMVRVGLALYGLYPSEIEYGLTLKPAMELKTIVTHIKSVDEGQRISYGGIYTTSKPERIATLPIGYADGFSRLLSGKARVIVGGSYAPVVGRICMDQCMIDVSNVNNINIEDEAVLFGKQGDKEIPIDEVAGHMGTISYELLCVIGKRVPRIYLKDGRVIRTHNYLV